MMMTTSNIKTSEQELFDSEKLFIATQSLKHKVAKKRCKQAFAFIQCDSAIKV